MLFMWLYTGLLDTLIKAFNFSKDFLKWEIHKVRSITNKKIRITFVQCTITKNNNDFIKSNYKVINAVKDAINDKSNVLRSAENRFKIFPLRFLSKKTWGE